LKQLHVVYIKVFHRMQYIRLLLFYSVIFQSVIFKFVMFQSCKFQSPVFVGLTGIGVARGCTVHPLAIRLCPSGRRKANDSDCDSHSFFSNLESLTSRNYVHGPNF